jgi:Domain of unknown function (DUF4907)
MNSILQMKKTMTITKHGLGVITVSVAIAASIPLFFIHGERKKIDFKTFHTATGWGYDILVDKKLFIHQEYIPVIAEKKGFSTEALAGKTAKMVIVRLKNNKLPTLTCSELNQICPPDGLINNK